MNDKDQFFTKISYPIIIYIPLILTFINASFILHQSVLLALLMSLLMGIFEDSRYISLNSVVQREVPKEALTSTYILNNLLNSIFFSLGTLGISLVVDNQGVMWAYVISSVAYVLTFVLGLYFKTAIKN